MGCGCDDQVLLSKHIPADWNGASDTEFQQNFSPQGNKLECKSLGLVFDSFWAFSGIAVVFKHVWFAPRSHSGLVLSHTFRRSVARVLSQHQTKQMQQTGATHRFPLPHVRRLKERVNCCPEGIDACLICVIYPYTTAIIPSPTPVWT